MSLAYVLLVQLPRWPTCSGNAIQEYRIYPPVWGRFRSSYPFLPKPYHARPFQWRLHRSDDNLASATHHIHHYPAFRHSFLPPCRQLQEPSPRIHIPAYSNHYRILYDSLLENSTFYYLPTRENRYAHYLRHLHYNVSYLIIEVRIPRHLIR